ncbi:glycerate kinase [Shewanella sp. OPT22]|nr:glycerate kinase [Shewanella sp. OPT22]
MKKIIVAPDSFKESLTAKHVAEAVEEGVLAANRHIEVIKLPIADGGEGTLDALSSLITCSEVPNLVSDALGRPVYSHFLLSNDRSTAMIEVAQSCGLAHIPLNLRNPMLTSSFGVGQQIALAIELGVKEIILALGGSATNDAGAGLLHALGAVYLGQHGEEVHVTGGNLTQIKSIDTTSLNPNLNKITFTLLCDVTNPLYGNAGASHTFGPQKGASTQQVAILDNNIQHFAALLEAKFGKPLSNIKGAGAAGGIPAVLIAIGNAKLTSGIDYILKQSQFSQHLQTADLVITGEGKIDSQTLQGKAVSGVATLAKEHKVPVVVLAGTVSTTEDLTPFYQAGINSIFSICQSPMSLETAFSETKNNLRSSSENLIRLLSC